MRLRVHTFGRELGTMELAKGVSQADIVEAMRRHQLWIAEMPAAEAAAEPKDDGGKGAGKGAKAGAGASDQK